MIRTRSGVTSHAIVFQGLLTLIIPGLTSAGNAADRHRIADASQAVQGRTGSSDTSQVVRRQQRVMGTTLEITVLAQSRSLALAASEAATCAVAEVDRRLSTWREDSALSAVNNRDSDQPVGVSPLLARDLAEALRWHDITNGAFNPGLGSLVSAWDLRGQGRVPSDAELHEALVASAMDGTMLVDRTLHLGRPGLQFEEGGFGKGVALRDALDAALGSGAQCVVLDFGGQVAVGGECGATAIGVADPNDRENEVAVLELFEGSAATSGLSERAFVFDGISYGHILDPRSGTPAPDWGSVTVVTSDPVAADCLATALFVMGPKAGGEWLQGRPEIEAVFVERSGEATKMTATPGLKGRLEVSIGNLTYLQQEQIRIEESTH